MIFHQMSRMSERELVKVTGIKDNIEERIDGECDDTVTKDHPSTGWDDFKSPPERAVADRLEQDNDSAEPKKEDRSACDWGFSGVPDTRADNSETTTDNSSKSKFIAIYERYLENKSSIDQHTKNSSTFRSNPQKALRDWFENEGHEFSVGTEQSRTNQYVCSIDLPIDDQDFNITSECHNRKQDAIDEICLVACRMLDECQLLYFWQSGTTSLREDLDRKRRLDEANKEDDIELDQTRTKHHCGTLKSRLNSNVYTYESLLEKWNELNMCILKLKAELVKLDLSVTKQASSNKSTAKTESLGNKTRDVGGKHTPNANADEEENSEGDDDSDEIDPLDEYMSSLETKTKLNMDEKIEKSRIKSQIAAYEREQSEVSRFIELAKPKFDLNKVCSTKPSNSAARAQRH